MKRDVVSRIELDVTEPAELVFSMAVSGHHTPVTEHIAFSVDGVPLTYESLPDAHGTRLHRVNSPVGRLVASYDASIQGDASSTVASPTDLITYRRPSRYAESDTLGPTAYAEFGGITDPAELLSSVSSWVGTHLVYVTGSSLPTDGATQTLLARQGVCRDYAHLTVALLRALNVPARVVSVYAPGLFPMDFHAVAEAWVNDGWHVVDATTLAPRSTLVRIATGRDAADSAFLTVVSGRADLVDLEVMAIVDELPNDDLTQLVRMR
ncbi:MULTISPECIES: transglutaminase-like domain-containing protein [unclassified Microbacterium]|uniref:transglutaminase-like domain-containing protein n=1 Tax=unclassified Microbacterium TaxID=2609290 RepID=UPI00214C4AB8|nr:MULTISPECIES: transglutaminase-like domain-containing protein [unclassified Microbacterium]MCR2810470.1 transglutaminase-like domain-containing protein [Microbacterium sp. zg.B185]WIM18521.1 transglutaminase-like domain-containing protein [Microbacterium sp. zg-B185]